MTPLSCVATGRLLQAYHDQELPVRDQIAVSAHVEWCESCAASLADLREIGSALSAIAHARPALTHEEASVFNQTVINRQKAEEDASLLSRLRYMFDDVRLVYAGGGAAVSCAICVVLMLGMMRFATKDGEKPDSLAAIVTLVSTPLECDPGVNLADSSGCHARWEARFRTANESAEQESVFALDAVVTHRSGQLTDLGRLRAGRRESAGQAQMIESLLDTVSRSRLESALPSGVPVTASMVWMVEHATVRANIIKPPVLEPIVPALKRRAETGLFRSTWS
jgi:Putative zinc-finger